MLTSLRQAVRALLRAPGFSVVAAGTLALGIGATAAVYTLLDAVVLRPLPYADAERLVVVEHAVPGVQADARWGLSQSNYFYYARGTRAVEALGLYRGDALTLAGSAGAEQLPAAYVTPNLLTAVLRLRPAAGRLFEDADSRRGAEPAVLVSHALWQQRFGGDPAVVGRVLRVGGRAVAVVGVLPPGAGLPDRAADLWLPYTLDPSAEAQNAHMFGAGLARLRAGATPAAAERELAPLAARLPALFPSAYSATFMRETGFRPVVTALRESVVGSVSKALWILLGAVGLVFAIAAANVANLLLVRAEGRRREVAVRAALGAGRLQLARQFLAEGAVLATAGGVVGLGLAAWGVALLPGLVPDRVIPRLAEVGLGWRSVAFAAAVSLGTALVVGLLPLAWAGAGPAALRGEGRAATASRSRHAVRHALVVGQVALAVVLLAAAGLMLESFRRLRDVQPGVQVDGVLAVDVALPYARYHSYARTAAFYRELLGRIEALPGVQRAGGTGWLPLDDDQGCSMVLTERAVPAGQEPPCVATVQVAPGYFAALGIALRGAAPGWEETERGAAGAVVSRALAARLWPGEDPIGRGIKGGNRGEFFRVVGVTGDVRADGLDQPASQVVYFPMVPARGAMLWSPPNYMRVVVRTAGGAAPESLVPAVRRLVAGLDPEVPLANARTMREVVAKSTARVSFTMALLATAAAMALVLSAVGLYGVLAYLVSLRTRELGVRVALGARPAELRRLVVLQSARLVAAGVAVGLAGALAATGVLRSLLFDVSPTDPRVLAAVSLLLCTVALAASYLPARRATAADPMAALRSE